MKIMSDVLHFSILEVWCKYIYMYLYVYIYVQTILENILHISFHYHMDDN
jgi:hypothetical protein